MASPIKQHDIELGTKLDGTWKQVDGTSIITFNDRYFEIINMELGIAGYGTIKPDRSNRLIIDAPYILYLNESSTIEDRKTKEFQEKAWVEYHKKHPEAMAEIFKEHPGGSITFAIYEIPYNYTLDKNILNLQRKFISTGGDSSTPLVNKSFEGQFIRQ
ncbi:hypothetical protein LQZ21_10705 [Treponema sp. TIM-1]|uniref:hypothetical protein n=1 Tax=Treponema sp. TIM-1 TaxID=2898417 RepID=UPI00398055E5